MDNINRHVLRLRQLAVAAKAAADAEDYAMNAGNEGEPPARDPASLQRVEQVRLTSGEVERMTPQLITAAQVCMKHICLRIILPPEKMNKKTTKRSDLRCQSLQVLNVSTRGKRRSVDPFGRHSRDFFGVHRIAYFGYRPDLLVQL